MAISKQTIIWFSRPLFSLVVIAAGVLGSRSASHAKAADLEGCYSIEAFGGKANATASNDVALHLALEKAGHRDICLLFGAGRYRFGEHDEIKLIAQQNLRILGSGKEVTELLWPEKNGGLTVSREFQNTLTIADLSLVTGAQGGGTALKIEDSGKCAGGKSTSNLSNAALKGVTNSNYYWNVGLAAEDLNLLDIANVDFFGDGRHGIGVYYFGKSASCLAVINNVNGSYFAGLEKGYFYGSFAQGVTISQSNFNGGKVGVFTALNASYQDQFTAVANQFNTGEEQIAFETAPTDLILANNLFFIPSGLPAVALRYGEGAHQHTIISQNIYRMVGSAVGGIGNAITGGAGQTSSIGLIAGNIFDGLKHANTFSRAADWRIEGNAYSHITYPDITEDCTRCESK